MKNRPNILIFNPDQWRGDVMGHLGNPAAVTPNLDALILQGEGVSFRYAFCQNPVCTPSRCSFMSGWYPHVRGHRTMYHMLHPELGEPNLLKILKDNGYFVWWGGKNDLVPAQNGYDPYCDIYYKLTDRGHRWGYKLHGMWDDNSWRRNSEGDNYYSFLGGKLNKEGNDIYCDPDWQAILGAVDFINEYQGKQPLCLFLSLCYPHPPYSVEDPWHGMIDRKKLPARTKAPKDWKGKPPLLKGISERQRLQNWTEKRWTELRATYYGACSRVDHQFGLITDALRKKGFYDNTAVFFFSDHGDFTGDYGLVEKTQNTFEDCLTRVPFVIKPPKNLNAKPGIRDSLVELIDFPATIFDLTKINPGYSHFGKSLLPLIAGKTAEHRDAVFSEGGRLHGEKHCMEEKTSPESLYWPRLSLQRNEGPEHTKAVMCRTNDYKYVRRFYEQDEFYDLVNDPHEQNNLINDSKYSDIILKLKERMLNWYMETCDVVPYALDKRWISKEN